MAKENKIATNERRKLTVGRYAARRAELLDRGLSRNLVDLQGR